MAAESTSIQGWASLSKLIFFCVPAVILPTVWRYLQTLDAPPYFLGLALSAFSFSGLLSGPIFGHWSDRTRTTKKIILFANLFEILGKTLVLKGMFLYWCRIGSHVSFFFFFFCSAGNFMYFMGFSKWLLLSSRLVAGELVILRKVFNCKYKQSVPLVQHWKVWWWVNRVERCICPLSPVLWPV